MNFAPKECVQHSIVLLVNFGENYFLLHILPNSTALHIGMLYPGAGMF